MNRFGMTLSAIITVATALCLATAADAAVYRFTYAGGGGFDGSGTITTSGIGDAETITSFSGTFDHAAISGLQPVGACCGHLSNDNLLYPADDAPNGPAYLDVNGFTFGLDGTAVLYNLYYGGRYAILASPNANTVSDGGTFNLSAVPEPASWGLMLTGFGVMGASLRRSRRRVTIA